jgi:hypothetical protein
VICNPLPGTFERRLESPVKPLPQVLCGQLVRFERHVRRRVEIENQPVGIIDRIDARTPRVYLYRPYLNDLQQTVVIISIEVPVILPVLR